MEILFIFLSIILVLILAILIVFLIIFNKVKRTVGSANMRTLFDAMKNAKQIEVSEYSRVKNVNGMTKLVEPRVIEQFPDFNKEVLYSQVEKNLTKIFNALEDKNVGAVKQDKDLVMVYKNVEDKINDLISCGISLNYDGVKFHRHALKKYTNLNGVATVEVSSTVEYYYNESGNEKVKISKKHSNVKKQTRYTTEFAYIYDESKFNINEINFAISCPSCGAPLTDIKNCMYCGTYVEPVNLKCWKMISYKEDYK